MANIALNDMMNELIARLDFTVGDAFQDRLVTIQDMQEAEKYMEGQGFPFGMVAYEGMDVAGGNAGNSSTGKPSTNEDCSAYLVNVRFSVIVVADYRVSSFDDDTKPTVLGYLDLIRRGIHGYKGVNNRPWRFVTEGPIEPEVDGVLLYAQLWETTTTEQQTLV